ncbi:hypothetical protein ACFQO1_12530 [Jejudonia soesokkakensis]|uniref:Tissue inhibitor of metalloproteinase n=1 Tax=Jejudonia soesokkakensis TaxID=1323432 RepID=A0ABW2MYC5_9FLAO
MKNSVLFVLLVFFSISNAIACTCVFEKQSLHKKVKIAYATSKVVFTGNVIAKKNIPDQTDNHLKLDLIRYTFEVINPFKNTEGNETIDVISLADGGMCGYTFVVGKTYLVYARTSESYSDHSEIKTSYTTGLCDRNNTIRNVNKRELRKLRYLKKRKQ